MCHPMIRVHQLRKDYGGKPILKGISFDLNEREILCFLGPNGAGKSTTIRILTGVMPYEGGTLLFNGKPLSRHLRAFQQQLGVVPQNISLYEDLTATQNIRFFASLYGLRGKALSVATHQALDFAGLEERGNDQVHTFSGGMKRRLNIACAIAHQPSVLIMDEPTVGVDPHSRNHILEGVKKMRDQGMTILYTTHYMEEVEEIATRIIIMDQGEIIAQGSTADLKKDLMRDTTYTIEVDAPQRVNLDAFYGVEGVRHVALSQNRLEISTLSSVENLDRLITCLVDHGVRIHHLSTQANSLETVFLNLTGRRLRD